MSNEINWEHGSHKRILEKGFRVIGNDFCYDGEAKFDQYIYTNDVFILSHVWDKYYIKDRGNKTLFTFSVNVSMDEFDKIIEEWAQKLGTDSDKSEIKIPTEAESQKDIILNAAFSALGRKIINNISDRMFVEGFTKGANWQKEQDTTHIKYVEKVTFSCSKDNSKLFWEKLELKEALGNMNDMLISAINAMSNSGTDCTFLKELISYNEKNIERLLKL